MNELGKLELFGKEIIDNLRDRSIEEYLSIKNGNMKSIDAQDVFRLYNSIDISDQGKVDAVILNIIDRVLHNALLLFEQSSLFTIVEKQVIDVEEDITEMSDGLSGELYSEDGWIERLSKFPKGTLG